MGADAARSTAPQSTDAFPVVGVRDMKQATEQKQKPAAPVRAGSAGANRSAVRRPATAALTANSSSAVGGRRPVAAPPDASGVAGEAVLPRI